MSGNSRGQHLVGWILPLALLALWQGIAMLQWIPNRLLPPPTAVLQAAWRLAASRELGRHIAISTLRAGMGLAVGGSIGFVLGLLTGLSARAERLLDTSVQMVRNVPHLALIPLVIVWLGIGEGAKLSLVALGVFFPIYVNTFHGIRTVDPGLIEMARVYGLRSGRLVFKVLLPGALPSILVGLRFALGTMWLTLIVAETISANAGIGYLAMNAREFMQTDVVMLSILIYALLGKLADTTARNLEKHCLRWHPAYAAAPRQNAQHFSR